MNHNPVHIISQVLHKLAGSERGNTNNGHEHFLSISSVTDAGLRTLNRLLFDPLANSVKKNLEI